MRNIFTNCLILLPLLIFTFQNINAQRWLKTYDTDQAWGFRAMQPDEEGIYVISGNELIRVDSLGEFLWKVDLQYSVREVVFRENDFVTVSVDSIEKRLVTYSYSGILQWDHPLGFNTAALPTTTLAEAQNEELAIIHPEKVAQWNTRLAFEKRDKDGNQLFKKYLTPGDTALAFTQNAFFPMSNGTFFTMGYKNNHIGGNIFTMGVDENGDVLWENYYDNDITQGVLPAKVIETNDGHLIISTWEGTGDGNINILKISFDGDIIWEKALEPNIMDFVSNEVLEMPSGNLLHISRNATEWGSNGNPVTIDVRLMMMDKNGVTLWVKDRNYFPLGVSAENVIDFQYLGPNQLLMGGYLTKSFVGENEVFLIRCDTFGNVHPHFIGGSIFQDQQADCQFDGDENGFENRIISFKDGNEIYHALSDETGLYYANLPSGDYEVTVDNMQYWESCQSVYNVSIDDSDDTTGLYLPMRPVVNCPLMEVDIAAPFLRLCAEGYYTVKYCNAGTVSAQDASLEVVLGDDLNFISAEFPLSLQDGQKLTFDLGTVNVMECNNFRIYFEVTCDEELFGQTRCTEAHIYPDHTCGISFIGPEITATGLCENDSIQFNLINEGEDMQEPQGYIVIEDNIILMSGDFQLLQGETKTSKLAATNGATYHLVAAQAPNLPNFLGSHIATATVEGCVGEVNEGAFNQLPFDDDEPWVATICHPILASYDPNDKTAFPSGWTEDHIIDKRTDLEYLIRFQNTGTDTAFKVVIVDTLSQFLDLSTIRPGTGSHHFRFEMTEEGVVSFTFDNILLPDSTTNEAESHGFVKFRISQKPANEIGTRIENTAYIYFDYNSAVQTNTVFHTIGEPWVQVVSGSVKVFEPGVQVAVSPNPFFEQATVELTGWNGTGGIISLFDMNGQAVLEKEFIGKKIILERKDIPVGIYFFKIENKGELIGTGKVVVK